MRSTAWRVTCSWPASPRAVAGSWAIASARSAAVSGLLCVSDRMTGYLAVSAE